MEGQQEPDGELGQRFVSSAPYILFYTEKFP